ncbi:aldehyde dehydrogenase [Alicyclobacillus cycloheptanicus]|jgi:aminomuconate-semialdehyde/2-hydroxymuconate-6-semialdehyde dehydrogenase|uniref:Aminomuconate-semialdehyde/2-hydroxymuconate-6-semialdehyde dehydrogenase n=1 Tax=Alicyclobacillus cycloheptanicus TaxID=1457 RepID=A0ABT9XIZ6_9BACL|nr:aldehyde dehydrogenase [Alicyclobacillus cycloheptanicus]MDQ0190283.1 aminomuconate-semialdehyde/2-hydroxymuconate-6-semialdehyde dehydrogenase [Alicyclobacillus cycloheptanicus]
MEQLLHFINGAYVPSVDGRTFHNVNPATGEVIGQVAEGGREDINKAVAAAKAAFKTWGKTTPAERSAILNRIADIIESRVDELALDETRDTGKPLSLSKSLDIPRAAYNFRFFADFVKGLGTECYEMEGVALNYALRRPVGVAGLISPWNLPLLLLTWKVAPALAAGDTCVIKPAELTPTTATKLAAICKEAGLPDGVLNVVHGFGPDAAGSFLTEHPDVSLISLTGETTTGKAVMKAASGGLKRLSFELGGKNPNIIFADADLDDAIETTIRSSFSNQGEVCLCGSRIYVERPLYDTFVAKFADRASQLVVGDPMDAATNVGALISEEHLHRVEGFVSRAAAQGARILLGGKRPDHMAKGYYLEPTIIVDVDDSCEIVQQEVFGPVVTIQPFDSVDEVIARANDTHYGLSATLWTTNLKKAHLVAGQLEAGIIWVNTWFLRDLRTPFGGMKESGIGREGGVHSFEFYSELKNVCVKL